MFSMKQQDRWGTSGKLSEGLHCSGSWKAQEKEQVHKHELSSKNTCIVMSLQFVLGFFPPVILWLRFRSSRSLVFSWHSFLFHIDRHKNGSKFGFFSKDNPQLAGPFLSVQLCEPSSTPVDSSDPNTASRDWVKLLRYFWGIGTLGYRHIRG